RTGEVERRALAHGRAGLQGVARQPPAFLERAPGTRLAPTASRQRGRSSIVIQMLLVADGPDGAATTVSTTSRRRPRLNPRGETGWRPVESSRPPALAL